MDTFHSSYSHSSQGFKLLPDSCVVNNDTSSVAVHPNQLHPTLSQIHKLHWKKKNKIEVMYLRFENDYIHVLRVAVKLVKKSPTTTCITSER